MQPNFVGHFTQSEATAAQRTFTFFAPDITDGFTAEAGLNYEDSAADVQVSKNGGAFANATGVVTEVAVGVYQYVAATAELDTIGTVVWKFVDAAARTVFAQAQVVAFDLNTATVTIGTGGITAASFNAGAIDAAAIGTAAIDADAIATDALGSLELAAGAAGEIADAVWDEAVSGHVAAGSFGLLLQVVKGLSQGNVVIDGGDGVLTGPTYDASGMLTAGRIRIFATGAAAEAATAGQAAGAGSELAAFTIATSGSNGRPALHVVSED